MDIYSLVQRLRDADPGVRVETLRILAMVEETQALEPIRWVYQHDLDPNVRQVAYWAGQIVWQAQQRGHSTQQAMEAMFNKPISSDHEDLYLSEFQIDVSKIEDRTIRHYVVDADFRRRLSDVLLDHPQEPPHLPDKPSNAPTRQDPDDLLEAGLTDLSFE
jgi:hypothetical protein